MARIATPGLLERLAEAGLTSFIRRGYRRTRIADVAVDAGIAPGTVYLYVSGKEALFDLALQVAFHEPDALDVETPYAPRSDDLVERTWAALRARDPLDDLRSALARAAGDDPPNEWPELLHKMWAWMSRYARAIALIEACATDWPDLGLLFYRQFRREALHLLARYMESRAASGSFAPVPDSHVAARIVVETMAYFAMHIYRDPDSTYLANRPIENTIVAVLDRAMRSTAAHPGAHA